MKNHLIHIVTQSHKCFSLREPFYFTMQQNYFMHTSCFIIPIIKDLTKGSRFNKINNELFNKCIIANVLSKKLVSETDFLKKIQAF